MTLPTAAGGQHGQMAAKRRQRHENEQQSCENGDDADERAGAFVIQPHTGHGGVVIFVFINAAMPVHGMTERGALDRFPQLPSFLTDTCEPWMLHDVISFPWYTVLGIRPSVFLVFPSEGKAYAFIFG